MDLLIFTGILFSCCEFLEAVQGTLPQFRHYETLSQGHYRREHLHLNHIRSRRSTENIHFSLVFHAHNRPFHLRLRRDTSVFSPDVSNIVEDGKSIPHDVSHIYEGYIQDEENSLVQGSIIDGVFAGTIHTGQTIYYVERSEFYFSDPHEFHSIIYKEKDILTPELENHNSQGSCGIAALQKIDDPTKDKDADSKKQPDNEEDKHHSIHDMYANPRLDIIRKRREIADGRSSCSLFLESDNMLWDYMVNPRDQGGMGFDYQRAKDEITAIFGSHVQTAKTIFENTTFPDSSYNGITFVVHKIRINESSKVCPDGVSTKGNKFCLPNMDVTSFLTQASLANHDDYCLAYTFTYRYFTGGVLGLAWAGSSSPRGGICEVHQQYKENNRMVSQSRNTGIVTLNLYNRRVAPRVSTLTFTHEIGHSFGSLHDEKQPCFGGGRGGGHFLMNAGAVTGDQANNRKFSSCSIGNMTKVLDMVTGERGGKRNCFLAAAAGFCGNQIVEDGEECDCGFEQDCVSDNCCNGQGSANPCTLKPTAACSPSQGPCCRETCEFVTAAAQFECRSESECSSTATCDGTSARCTTAAIRPNATYCNSYSQVCNKGECVGSICATIGWEQCYINPPPSAQAYDRSSLCYVACQDPTSDSPRCISTADDASLNLPEYAPLKQMMQDIDLHSIQLTPGSPCDDYRGYCDVFQVCQRIDSNGPLSKLKQLLFSKENFQNIKDWAKKYWWGILLIVLGFIIIMIIIVKVCSPKAPSDDPLLEAKRENEKKDKKNKPAAKATKDNRQKQMNNNLQLSKYDEVQLP